MWVQHVFRSLRACQYHAAAAEANVPYVFVLGGPGAGKGTQCSLLAKEFGFHHLSAGALLRNFIAQGGPEADELAHMINDQGKIITVRLLMEAMRQSRARLCLIDGFPRNTDNLHAWDTAVPHSCEFVLNFSAPFDILQQRLLGRADGSRSDDTAKTIHRRFHTFQESTQPVLEHFEAMGKLHTVDATDGITDVYQSTRMHFCTLLERS